MLGALVNAPAEIGGGVVGGSETELSYSRILG